MRVRAGDVRTMVCSSGVAGSVRDGVSGYASRESMSEVARCT